MILVGGGELALDARLADELGAESGWLEKVGRTNKWNGYIRDDIFMHFEQNK